MGEQHPDNDFLVCLTRGPRVSGSLCSGAAVQHQLTVSGKYIRSHRAPPQQVSECIFVQCTAKPNHNKSKQRPGKPFTNKGDRIVQLVV